MIVTDVNDKPNGFSCHFRFCLLDCTRSQLIESFTFTTRITDADAATAVAVAVATATANAAATLALIARNRTSKLEQDEVATLESRRTRAGTIDTAQSIE